MSQGDWQAAYRTIHAGAAGTFNEEMMNAAETQYGAVGTYNERFILFMQGNLTNSIDSFNDQQGAYAAAESEDAFTYGLPGPTIV